MRTSQTLAAISASILTATVHAGGVLYVDDDALPGGNGTSWATAYRFLADALADAAGGGVTEIRIAEGVYIPDRDELNPFGTGDAAATFQLLSGVTLAGGYAGLGDPDARDIALYETVFSGDLFEDDGPDFADNDENSHSVVTASFTDLTAVLDGVTITAGNADGLDTDPLSWQRGAGIWNLTGSPTIAYCRVVANWAEFGGGMYNSDSSSPILTGVTFDGNTAEFGGAMDNFNGGNASMFGCTFTNNTAVIGADGFGGRGGAVWNNNSDTVFNTCVFQDNSAESAGGGIGNSSGTTLVLDCSFIDNTVDQTQTPAVGGGLAARGGSRVTVTGSLFTGNTARDGGGIFVQEAIAHLNKCRFLNNVGSWGGALSYFNGVSTHVNCLIAGNMAVVGADGGYGGGVYSNSTAMTRLVNCTVADNTAAIAGGAVFTNGALTASSLTNCIVWGNTSGQFAIANGGLNTVDYSCVQDGFAGIGNIIGDPLFVDPMPLGNYRLSPGSPCIDAGDNMAPELVGVDTDLDGDTRFVDDPCTDDTGVAAKGEPVIDMGAYEFQGTSTSPDIDGDGVGITDLLILLAAWGPCGAPCLADLDCDGSVGITDLLILLAAWG